MQSNKNESTRTLLSLGSPESGLATSIYLHPWGAGGRAGQGAREGDPVLGELSGLPPLGPPEKYVERLWNCPPGGGQEAGDLTAPAPQ